MARILIFDWNSGAQNPAQTQKSDGEAYGNQFELPGALSEETPKRSNPVRCFCHEGEVRLVGVEFLLENYPQASQFALRWWPEYLSDQEYAGGTQRYPTGRDWPEVNPNIPWQRALVASNAGSGLVDMNALTYRMTMQDRNGNRDLNEVNADSLYAPLSVHALWMRIAVWLSLTDSSEVTADILQLCRLRIFAHLGAHAEQDYIEEQGNVVYAYNAF